MRVQTVRGRLDDETGQRLVDFWTAHGALDEAAARKRLAEVVCVLFDGDEIAGVNSVYSASAPLVRRPFWLYRRFVRGGVGADAEAELFNCAFEELQAGFTGTSGDPLGLCVLVADPAQVGAGNQAVWPTTNLLFAGYERDAQVRIRYFEGATI